MDFADIEKQIDKEAGSERSQSLKMILRKVQRFPASFCFIRVESETKGTMCQRGKGSRYLTRNRSECIKCMIFGNTLKKELKTMKSAKTKKIRREDIPNLEQSERVKYEIAEELGLLDKVLDNGWKSLSSKETGRIGGIISKKSRKKETGNLQ